MVKRSNLIAGYYRGCRGAIAIGSGDNETHQPLGPKPMEATIDEDVRGARVDRSAIASSAPSPDMLTTSAQQA